MRLAFASIISVAGLSIAPLASAEQLNIFNWSDYIDEDSIPNFIAETGIETTYDTFDSNETLEALLLAGDSGYDIVVPSDTFLKRQSELGVFQPLDKSRLVGLENLNPFVMSKIAAYDEGGTYSVPYMWGTTGIGYGAEAVEEKLGVDAPTDSWSLVFDPANAAKLGECGFYMLDAPDQIIPAALNYLGLNPDSQDPAELVRALEVLMPIRPYITKLDSSEYIDALASGEICVAVGWSGDIFIARDAAEDVTVEYVVPSEGALMWFDLMAIPADAANVDQAYTFLNYMLRPEVIAAASNYVYYANANQAAFDQGLIDEEVTGDPAIYPDEATLEKLYTTTPYSFELDEFVQQIWATFVAG